MSRTIETIYRYMAGLDMEPKPVVDFVAFVENLTAQGWPFAVLQKTTGIEVGEEAIEQELQTPKPLIGYGGTDTFPFISDPDEKILGAFAILDRQLIYSRRGVPLHQMRDSYTWAFAPVSYYINRDVTKVVYSFIVAGYDLLLSNNLVDYRREYRFDIVGRISLKDILNRR